MTRGRLFGLLAAVAALAALAALPVTGAGARPRADATSVKYEMTVTGLVFIKHTDSGLEPNGSDCNLSADDAHSPFSNHSQLKVSWDSVFRFAFNPKASRGGVVTAKRTRLRGSSFSYGGFDYDSCLKITWGPGGKDCTGTLANQGKAALLAKFTHERANEDLKFIIQPFGELVGTPASCKDDDDPPASHDADGELGLVGLGEIFTPHVYSTVERISHGVTKTLHFTLDQHINCSDPGSDPGDTDTCSTTRTGDVYVTIRPLD